MTLLIQPAKSGENEYDPALLKKAVRDDVYTEDSGRGVQSESSDRTEKQYKPARIIIEYNGMWNFVIMKLPWYWKSEEGHHDHRRLHLPMY